MTATVDAPVVIAGAGSTGATLALLLARRGIRSVVLDRRVDEMIHPAAHVIHARSLEIWREASPDLATQIAALAPPIETVNLIRWCSRLDEPPLGEIDLMSRPEQLDRVRAHSDFLISHIGQHLLMPELWSALDREPLIEFHRGAAAELLKDQGGHVTVHLRDGDTVTGRYLVAADGANSTLRTAAGITMRGPLLARMGSAFFRAPGLYPADRRPLLSWIYRPHFAGVLIAHADDHYVLMNTYLHPGQEVAISRDSYWEGALPVVLGAQQDVDIVSTGTWEMTSQTAQAFRRGRLILAGDAAHRFPHTGGYGLNSGVQDAHNLAWKLDAVLAGRADDALLDTYETERRPVIERFAHHSVRNHFHLDTVTKHFGVRNRMLHRATEAMSRRPLRWLPAQLAVPLAESIIRQGIVRTRILEATGWRARRVRDKVAAHIPQQLPHFVSSGLEFGYAYGGPLIATEPVHGIGGDAADDVVEYKPTTRPGGRLPHLLVDTDDGPVSTLALVDTDSGTFTLFTGDPAWWSDHLGAGISPLSIRIVDITAASRLDATEATDFGIATDGAVVVRADGHIIWRTAHTADTGMDELTDFLQNTWLNLFQPVDDHHPARTSASSAI